jgi:hypothetical protein
LFKKILNEGDESINRGEHLMPIEINFIVDPIFNPGNGIRVAIESVTPVLTTFLKFLFDGLTK